MVEVESKVSREKKTPYLRVLASDTRTVMRGRGTHVHRLTDHRDHPILPVLRARPWTMSAEAEASILAPGVAERLAEWDAATDAEKTGILAPLAEVAPE